MKQFTNTAAQTLLLTYLQLMCRRTWHGLLVCDGRRSHIVPDGPILLEAGVFRSAQICAGAPGYCPQIVLHRPSWRSAVRLGLRKSLPSVFRIVGLAIFPCSDYV